MDFNKYTLETADATLDVYPRDFAYVRKSDVSTGGSHPSPSRQAADAAKAFLSQHSLLPEHAEVGETWASANTGITTVEFRDARLNQNMPEFYIAVDVDVDGGIQQVNYRWYDIVFLGNYPVISEAGAANRIFDGPATYSALNVVSQTQELLSPQLGYEMAYDTKPGSNVAIEPIYYLPYYRFCQTNNSFACIRVPALPLEYILPPGTNWPPEEPTATPP